MSTLPSVGAYIKVTGGGQEWTQLTSVEELSKIQKLEEIFQKTATIWERLSYPIHTNTVKNFAKDFFLPLTVDHLSKKTKNVFEKAILLLGNLYLDLFFFPIRVITAIPRIIYNTMQEKPAFHQYLEKAGAPKEIYESDSIKMKFLETKGRTYLYEKQPAIDYEIRDNDGSSASSGSRASAFQEILKIKGVTDQKAIDHLTPKMA